MIIVHIYSTTGETKTDRFFVNIALICRFYQAFPLSYHSRSSGSVTVGQTVAQGEVIAKSDDSGFGDSSRMHLGFSVGRTFVSPLWILDKGLPN